MRIHECCNPLGARSVESPILHDIEADSLALIQAVQSRAFDSAYRDQDLNPTAIGLDEPIALMNVERSHGSKRHCVSSQGHVPGRVARTPVAVHASQRRTVKLATFVARQ